MEPALSASLAALLAVMQPQADAAALASQCEGRDGWSDPAPPARIHGGTYYVGTCGISAILITGPAGHVLIDGGPAEAAPLIAANVERLGFRMADVRLILNSHEHHDHAGGIAGLQRLSGATVAALAAALPTLASGTPQAGDPQYGILRPFPAATAGRTLRDGETVRIGPIRLTAHATPGHTAGSTSWSWRSCEGPACLTIVYADSVTAVSADGYRFSDHPGHVAAFRRSLARIGGLRCDLLLTPHPGASNLFERFAQNRLAAPGACRAYAARGASRLDERLRQEGGR
jgi:metallo-beta-lactamase class B